MNDLDLKPTGQSHNFIHMYAYAPYSATRSSIIIIIIFGKPREAYIGRVKNFPLYFTLSMFTLKLSM